MADENSVSDASPSVAVELDPAQLQYLKQRLESEQNLGLAIVAGAGASLLGAAAWAAATVATGYQIGFFAIGIGFLVGFAVRTLGKGITSSFGVVGGFWSLLGCAVGNLLTVTAMIAREEGIALGDVISRLTPELIQQLMVATFSPMDLVFYGIAVYYGYRLSFRELGRDEFERMLSGGAVG